MKITLLFKKYNNLSEPVKASLWYTVCNVLLKGIALLSTPIFTRILSEEQYGTYTIFQSWYSILIIFTSLNLFLSGYTKGLILYKEHQEEFTSALLTLSTAITIIFGLIYLMNADFWNNLFELSPALMVAMFVELLTMPAVEFWAAKQRFDYKYKKFVIVSIVTVLVSLVLGIVTVLTSKYKVEARVYSDVFAKAIFGISFFMLIILRGRTGFNKKYWKYALVFNIPLIPHYLSTFILNQSDRIMIGKLVGNTEAAYYSVAYTISTMILLITTAINSSLVPYTYKTIQAGKSRNIRNSTEPLFLLIALLCILTMAFAPEIILVFAGKEYSDAMYVIPPVAASVFFIFVYSMFSTIEYYYQMTGFIAIASCISALLNIILNYIFIPIMGYYAAGYTTLVSYICLATMHYIFYKGILKKEFLDKSGLYDIRMILIYSIVLIIFMVLMTLIYQWIFVRYILTAVLCIVVFLKRKYILGSLKNIK